MHYSQKLISQWEAIQRKRELKKQNTLGVVVKVPVWYWLEWLWARRN
jgi:hypothetical protein